MVIEFKEFKMIESHTYIKKDPNISESELELLIANHMNDLKILGEAATIQKRILDGTLIKYEIISPKVDLIV